MREDDDGNDGDDDDDDSGKGIGSDECGDGEEEADEEEEDVAFPFRLEDFDDPFPEFLLLRLLLFDLAKPRLTSPLAKASKGDTNSGGAEGNEAERGAGVGNGGGFAFFAM